MDINPQMMSLCLYLFPELNADTNAIVPRPTFQLIDQFNINECVRQAMAIMEMANPIDQRSVDTIRAHKPQ